MSTHILLLEDNSQATQQVLGWLADLYGPEARCVQVTSIHQALMRLEEEPLDLFLLDLSLFMESPGLCPSSPERFRNYQ